MEPRVPYTVDVLLTLDVTSDIIVEVPIRNDGYSDLDPAPPSDLYDPSSANDLVMLRPVYDESLVPEYNKESTFLSESGIGILTFLFALVIILLIVGGATSFLILRRGPKSYEAELVTETETNM